MQLDSDDIYKDETTLQRVVDAFRKENCAMLIGSYQMTNFKLEEIPPGVIDHKEWTPDNGRNNALRINGLGALMHDAAHYRGYANRELNDFVGELLALPTSSSMAGYQFDNPTIVSGERASYVVRDTTAVPAPPPRRPRSAAVCSNGSRRSGRQTRACRDPSSPDPA